MPTFLKEASLALRKVVEQSAVCTSDWSLHFPWFAPDVTTVFTINMCCSRQCKDAIASDICECHIIRHFALKSEDLVDMCMNIHNVTKLCYDGSTIVCMLHACSLHTIVIRSNAGRIWSYEGCRRTNAAWIRPFACCMQCVLVWMRHNATCSSLTLWHFQ